MNTRIPLLLMLAGVAFLSNGCSTMSDTAKGAGIGGALGTGAGLALGAATGNPRTGAVVGGLLGAGTGAAIGNASDNEKAERREYQQAVATAQAAQIGSRLGMTEVIDMARQGQSDSVIINQIRATHSTFQLSTADLNSLKQNGVSDAVIIEMQNARPVGPVVAGPQPVYVRGPRTVVYEPAPVFVYGRPYRHWHRCWP